jgi:hypothetical protein
MLLGLRDARVVELIVGMGLSIEQGTAKVYPQASRSDREAVGRKLREGLEKLADAWIPAGRAARATEPRPMPMMPSRCRS